MNEQLEKALVQIIEKASSGVEAGINFLSAEIPDVIYQLLAWKLAEAAFYIAINLIILVVLLTIAIKFGGKGKKIDSQKGSYSNHERTLTHDEDGDLHQGVVGVGTVMCITLSITITNIFTYGLVAIQIYVAPKIFLLEYASNLVK